MFYDLGLCVTIALAGWLSLDHLDTRRHAGQSLPIGLIGIGAVLWAAGEVAIRGSAMPEELAFGRRVFFLGVCSLPVFWFWVGVQAAAPRWSLRWPWLPTLFALPTAIIYSSLYWDESGRFVSLVSASPSHGPWFVPHVVISYTLLAAGTLYFLRAARELGRGEPLRLAAIAAAVLLPITGNAAYIGGLLGGFDPSPLLLSIAAVLMRFAIIDSGLALSLPLARHDVVEQLGVGIAVGNLRAIVVDSNPTARKLLGVDPSGLTLEEASALAHARTDAAIDVQSMPLETLAGRVGTALVLTDHTSSRNFERRLQRAARLESIGSLTAGIAHEVNNPLAYIRANLGMLEKFVQTATSPDYQRELPPALREAANEAVELVCETQDGVERIANLVERLKTFARDTPYEANASPIDLSWVVKRAVALASVGPTRDAIQLEIGDAPPVLGYESELVQIVLNLVVNALQASDTCPDVSVECGSHPEGAFVRVLDRGRGIAADALEHVFDPFFTTKAAGQGTGLGLSVSYDLARQHRGRLEASNRAGGGAQFTLVLPAHEVPATAAPPRR